MNFDWQHSPDITVWSENMTRRHLSLYHLIFPLEQENMYLYHQMKSSSTQMTTHANFGWRTSNNLWKKKGMDSQFIAAIGSLRQLDGSHSFQNKLLNKPERMRMIASNPQRLARYLPWKELWCLVGSEATSRPNQNCSWYIWIHTPW